MQFELRLKAVKEPLLDLMITALRYRSFFPFLGRSLNKIDAWTIGSVVVAMTIAIPISFVIWLAFSPTENVWPHLFSTVLPRLVGTTLILMLGVAIGTCFIGVGTAWLVTMCQFPGRRFFEWALLLPLAVPSYVIAFVYTDLLEFAGPLQGSLRGIYGWTTPQDYWFPEVRSLGGATSMMSLVLYPYVYLFSRAAFLEQTAGVLEVSRTLGYGPWRSFFTISVPLARPAVVVGLILVMMETLNDFGTVDLFGVQTLTLGIFDVWLNMNNVGGAAQIAVVMLMLIALLIAIERFARRKKKFHQTSQRYKRLASRNLTMGSAFLASIACTLPILLGFIVPFSVLIRDATGYFNDALDGVFLMSVWNSLSLAGLASVLAVSIGVLLAYGMRLNGWGIFAAITRFASLGYAIPGAVLAIGIFIPMGLLDNSIDEFMRNKFGISTGLLLSGSIAALTFAYVVRFLALSLGAVEVSLGRITNNIDGVAKTLGASHGAILWRVHLPMIRASLLTGAILVFVDVMKELPMTVIMRPFNFETLATQVYQFSAAEQFEQAAPAALTIVASGIIPVILLSIAITKVNFGRRDPLGVNV